jgi:two-component system sensor kinase FixL
MKTTIRQTGSVMNRTALEDRAGSQIVSEHDANHPSARRRKLIATFTAAVCMSGLIGFASYWTVIRVRTDAARVTHSYEVMGALDLVLATANDVESAGRGYAITGRDDYLQPYVDSTGHIKNDLTHLQALTVDDAAQQRRYGVLEALMTERLAFTAQVIDARRDGGFQAAALLLHGGRGQAIGDEIRRRVAEMADAERALLTQRQAETDRIGQAALLIIIIGSALTVATALAALMLVRRDFAGVERARTALAQANAALEARVSARTAELSRIGERLAKANTELRSLVAQAPLAFAMLDRNMTYIAASKRWCAKYVNGRTDVVGINYYDLHPDIPQTWVEIHRRALAGELVTRENDVWVRADGRTNWLRWAASPWYTELGEIGGITIFAEDVTNERVALLALRESEERLSGIFNSAMDAIVAHDEQGRIRFFNAAASRMFGLPANEVIGGPLSRLIPERLRKSHAEHVATFSRTGVAMRRMGAAMQVTGLRASGEEFPVDASISQVTMGKNRMFTVILRDISGWKKAEAELAELRKEREHLREIEVASHTATSIAHELNQPLTAVMSYSEAAMLMLRAGDAKPDRLAGALEKTAQQARRAGKVMRELIEHFHKGSSGSETVDLEEVIQSATAIVSSAGYDGFEVLMDGPAMTKPVQANRTQLEKVLTNLLRNGAEAMLNAGIAAKTIRIGVHADADDKMAQVTITDNGPGIDKDLAERIFEPSFTTKPLGVGMGLTISRSLVEANGGRLWVDPGAGPGAAFHFTLPMATSGPGGSASEARQFSTGD